MSESVDAGLSPSAAAPPDEAAIAQVFRREFGQAVATLIRVFGDIDIAEDAVSEAFTVAVEHWSRDGLPPNPGGWITTTAKRRALDRLRREARREDGTPKRRCCTRATRKAVTRSCRTTACA